MQAIDSGSLAVHRYHNLRNQRLFLHGDVHHAWHGFHDAFQFAGLLTEDFQAGAKHLDGDLGADSALHMLQAVRDRLSNIDRRSRQNGEFVSNLRDDLLFVAQALLEVDLNLCVMDPLRVLI